MASLAQKADLAQILLGNLVPIRLDDMETNDQVSIFHLYDISCQIIDNVLHHVSRLQLTDIFAKYNTVSACCPGEFFIISTPSMKPVIILQVEALVQRLVYEEHYALAAYVTKRWGLDARNVWEQWAHSLIL